MFDSVFKNIGHKLKFLANLNFWLSVVSFTILGLVQLLEDNAMGFLVIILGVLIAWVTNCVLYGFGELIDNVNKISNSLTKGNQNEFVNNENVSTVKVEKAPQPKLLTRLDVLNKLKDEKFITEEEFKSKVENIKC